MKDILKITSILALLMFGCKTGTEIKELTFAAIPSEDMNQTTKYTENISKYLEKELDIKVKHFIATDYTAVIEAMRSNKCQICIFGPFSYLLANQKAGAQALAAIGVKSGGLFTYYSYLITNKNTGIQNMDDVSKKAKTIDFGFTDPASTSGHLVPRGYLTSVDLDPEKSFASVAFLGNHGASLLSVYSGKIDLGACSSESYERLIANGTVDSSKYVIVWKSNPILTDPFCVVNSLPVELKERIRKAFLDMPEKDSAAFKQYIKYTFKGNSMRDSLIFRAVDDSTYNSLRSIARSVKSLNIN